MSPTLFQILLALASHDAAAAELWKQVQLDTEGLYWVPERTFYSALPSLMQKGLIERLGDGRGARYHLTPAGRKQLQRDGSRIKRAAALLRERL